MRIAVREGEGKERWDAGKQRDTTRLVMLPGDTKARGSWRQQTVLADGVCEGLLLSLDVMAKSSPPAA